MNENKSPDFIMESEVCKFMMNPLIRSQVSSHLSNWMFTINATKAISECILGNMFDGKEVETNYLVLYIKQNFKATKLSKEDYSTIFQILEGYKSETQIKEENFDFIVHTISEFIKSRLLVKGVEFFARGDQEKAYEYFETGVNFSISKSPFIDPSDENLILKLKELSFPTGKIMKSSISLINNSLIYKGYKYGDLIMVVAPPKVGKTTLLCQEGSFSAKNGLKVAHVCLGDMDNIDVVCKYTSVLTNEPMEVITDDPVKYFNEYPVVKEAFKNVRISCFPAGELGVRELLGHLRQLKRKFNYDMAIIDYDSNIAPPKGENMYEVGGIIYTALKGFAEKERCCILVGSQPKINFWDTELLPMESASESSRKQHAIDMMITMGRNKDCKFLGTLNIPAVRRGEGNVSVRINFEYKNSSIKELTQENYNRILNSFKSDVLDEKVKVNTFKDSI